MTEGKKQELLQRFMEAFERTINSDLPTARKLASVEALYIAYCTAIGKSPNYEILNNL